MLFCGEVGIKPLTVAVIKSLNYKSSLRLGIFNTAKQNLFYLLLFDIMQMYYLNKKPLLKVTQKQGDLVVRVFHHEKVKGIVASVCPSTAYVLERDTQ